MDYWITKYINDRQPWELDQVWEGMPRHCSDAWPWRAWQLSPEAEYYAWLNWELFVSAHRAILGILASFNSPSTELVSPRAQQG